MMNLEFHENFCRVKEVMGNTYEDPVILKALAIHQNDFERALNYLLEGNFNTTDDLSSSDQLRQSITDVFTSSSQQSQNARLSGTGEITWGESVWPDQTPSSPPLAPRSTYTWDDPPSEFPPPAERTPTSLEPVDEAREPLVLPNSPPKGSYQPVTVTGQTTPTEDVRTSDQAFPLKSKRQIPGVTTRSAAAVPPPRLDAINFPSPDYQLVDDSSDKKYEAELHAAIQASLASDNGLSKSNQSHTATVPHPFKDLITEDEQMSKALEESLAMSSSRTLEADGKFSHPPAHQRVRAAGSATALRVHNPHLVFLPCVLSAMYAAKPFRDRILAFQPVPPLANDELVEHDLEGLWDGKSLWRSGDNWPEKPQAIEIILAIQRLFAAMTHTKRSYLDVHELSLLLGYEEGEMISWSLNEPNRGCQKTYEAVAEAWRELTWTLFKENHPTGEDEKLVEEYEVERRLFHWKGHKVPLPLPDDEASPSTLPSSTDNSTTSLTLSTMGSTLNDVYACIDAQVWLPESNTAHFLDGTSHVLAFEIDRKSSHSNLSTGSHQLGEIRMPFKLEPEFWIDRYLLQKRHKIAELREEISRIEGEADVSLARRDQLSQAGGKDLLSTLRATVDYLSAASQFPSTTSPGREEKKKAMLPKFQGALARLEAELSSLDQKAKTAQAAAKGVFDVDEMKEVGPHDLCSVVVSDGFSGREHMWTYIKADDGRWFKSLDQAMIEVSLENVLNDPAGLHMNSGHIFAIYVRRPLPEEQVVDSLSIKLPAALERAVIKDNEQFEAELLESTTLPQLSYGEAEQDVVMSSDSPRSDVAEAGGGMESEFPLRLTGGARSDISEEGSENFEDEEEEGEQSGEELEELPELGFLKEITHPLDVKSMTGKVGGRPIWLDSASPLDSQSVTCCSCGHPMAFLMQMNAPEDSNPDAYFRTIYVFVCRKLSCLKLHGPGALKAFRIQLPETHQFSDHLSEQHLIIDKDPALAPMFREWELVCDEEPEDSGSLKAGSLTKVDSGIKDQDAKTKDTKAPVDQAFLDYQARIARAPDQVLRYLRVSTPLEPLWANERPTQTEAFQGMLHCSLCGRHRTAEFQILSTVLTSLGVDEHGHTDELDFGTIVVYTCPYSCSRPSSIDHERGQEQNQLSGLGSERKSGLLESREGRWVQEACWAQMFSDDGVFKVGNQSL